MLGGAPLGGALASVPGLAWAAKPGCLSGVTCKGQCCPVGASCVGGGRNQACACPQGQSVCGGVCRDLATDVSNCGACGCACATGANCVGGQCVCPSGQEVCGGRCVSKTCSGGRVLNPANCGCECPTGTTLCPGNNTCQSCPDGLVLNTSTCTCEVCVDGTGIGCPSGQRCCSNVCTFCTFCYSCHRGAVHSATKCACVCPPDLPSERYTEGAPTSTGAARRGRSVVLSRGQMVAQSFCARLYEQV